VAIDEPDGIVEYFDEADDVIPGPDRLRPLELKKRRRKPTPFALRYPPLTEELILKWADAHHAQTGRWPTTRSGAVADVGEITWRTVHKALVHGGHGLPGGDSLAGLLERERAVAIPKRTIELSEDAIRQWAMEHLRRTGQWPSARSGTIEEAPGETWRAINRALVDGKRGLPGGSSLAQVLNCIRGRAETEISKS
jgi:hypothetical protein